MDITRNDTSGQASRHLRALDRGRRAARGRGRSEDEARTAVGIVEPSSQDSMEVNTLRIFANLADRVLSLVVPQTTAAAASCGGGAILETQSRRCNYYTW